MLKKILAALGASALAATVMVAQGAAPQTPQRGGGQGRGGDAAQGRGDAAGGGRGSANLPTEAQWAAMSPKAKEYVDKAKAIAGDDPDLVFDFGIFCKASGGSQNPDRATVGVPNSEPKLEPYPAPSPAQVIGGQRLFDNFYWIGNTGIGAWLITSNDGYILFDTMNSEDDAKNIIIPAIEKLKLDPKKIKYLVFGHNHFDHTGGGEYIQRLTGAKAVMHRDDWEIYLKASGRGGGGGRGRGRGADATNPETATPPPAPAGPPPPKMHRDIDATDGMTLKVGDVTATIFQMTGHTPGSIGMVVPVRYQGRQHPILLVTAATDVHNREAFVGGYEHIWDEGIRMKVENVMQAHPNTNMNLLARTKYVNDHYPPTKNPLLYGAARTERYINIMRNCTLARMDILGCEVRAILVVAAAAVTFAAQTGSVRTVYVTAAAADGGRLEALDIADFVVREGEQSRKVLKVEPSRARLKVAIAVEELLTPDSDLRRAVANFIDQIRESGELALYTVGRRTEKRVGYSSEIVPFAAAINGFPVRAVEPGDLVQALHEIARDQRSLEGRHAIVAVATQTAQVSTVTADAVLQQLVGGRTVLYAATLMGSETSTIPAGSTSGGRRLDLEGQVSGLERDKVFSDGTRQSGGLHLSSQRAGGLWNALERIAAELQRQYVVSYDGDARADGTVSIESNRRAVTIRGPTRMR